MGASVIGFKQYWRLGNQRRRVAVMSV